MLASVVDAYSDCIASLCIHQLLNLDRSTTLVRYSDRCPGKDFSGCNKLVRYHPVQIAASVLEQHCALQRAYKQVLISNTNASANSGQQ